MSRMGSRKSLFLKKATAAGLALLLFLAGFPPAAATETGSCKGWRTAKFFESATVAEVTACLSAGEDPNEPDTQGLSALHRAARDTGEPAVIDALLDAGADPRAYSIAGRLPWDFARKNDKLKGSAAWQRLRIVSAKKPKKADWSQVQAVPRNTKTVVRLYQDAAHRENRRIRGRFHSATADSITLVLKDGQTREIPKQAVRKVLIRRPFLKRWPGWATLVVTSISMGILYGQDTTGGSEPGEVPLIGALMIGLPTLIAFLVPQRGPIYNIPSKHRMLPQGGKPSGAANKAGKQEDRVGTE